MATCLALAVGLTSCGDDGDEDSNGPSGTNTHEEIVDSEAGTFVLRNLATGAELSATGDIVFDDDSLQVEFVPKEEYRAMAFEVTCSVDGKRVEVKDGKVVLSTGSGTHELKCSAVARVAAAEDRAKVFVWSGAATYELERPASYANVPLNVYVSNDLLQFVTAELSYTDSYGMTHTHTIADDEWLREDSVTLYKFKDGDGVSHYRLSDDKSLDGEEDMTLTEVRKYLPNFSYRLNARFYALDATSEVTLSYKLRPGVVPDRATYEFDHRLRMGNYRVVAPGVLVVDGSSSYDMTVNIGGDRGIKTEDVKAYLDNLVATPDVLKLQIGKGGVKKLE